VTHVAPLLARDLDPHSRARGWPWLAAVEREQNAVVLGSVATIESVGQREDAARRPLLDAGVGPKWPLAEAPTAGRVPFARGSRARTCVQRGLALDAIFTEATLSRLE
jgi:hypothetical protein